MNGNKACSEDGCEKPVQSGLSVCSAHYMRKRRGSKIIGPIRPHEKHEVHLPGAQVSVAVMRNVRREAKRTGISEYELIRQITLAWAADGFLVRGYPHPHVRLNSGQGVRLPGARVEPAVETKLLAYGKKHDMSLYELVRQILEDWSERWFF